jgi:glycosyltransferase involved in cell wall biosynthesis
VKVVWMARAPAPYRYPIWDAVATNHQLTVGLLHPHGVIRDWTVQPRQTFEQVLLPAFGPRYREDAMWMLRPSWKSVLDGAAVVVLQGAWETPAFWQIRHVARRRSLRTVLFYEGTMQSIRHSKGLVARARSGFMKSMDSVITPGPSAACAVERHGVQREKIVESINVVDVRTFHEHARNSDYRRGQSRPGHRFLVAAQLIERKNIGEIIDAFAVLRGEHDELIIAGRGPLEADLRAKAVDGSVKDQIQFVGHQTEAGLQELYARSHTLVLASKEEVWGLVANEALASGLHVVVTRNCGVAASIEGMRGVFDCEQGLTNLTAAMTRSRAQWVGWLRDPEILQHNGARFAADLEVALTGK